MASDVSSYPQDDSASAAGDSGSDSSDAPDASAASDSGAGSAPSDSSNGASQDSSADSGSNGSASDSPSSSQDSSAGSDASASDSSSNGQDSSAADDSSSGGSAGDSSSSGAGQDSSASADSSSGGSGADSSSTGNGQDSSAGSSSGANGSSSGQSASASAGKAGADSAAGGASGKSASGGDQTPAKDLTVDPIQPASTTAVAAASGASPTSSDGSAAVPTAEGGVSVSDIIAIGTTAAKIMEASSPDYTMQGKPASVLPRGADPLALSGVVADPHELKITLHIRNKIHMLIIHLPIVVQWRFGGSYKGTGRYITSASAFLDSGADVGTFYKADVDASLTGPWNAGSDTNPVAAISVMIEVKVVDKTSPYGQNIVLEGSIQGDGAGTLKQRPNA